MSPASAATCISCGYTLPGNAEMTPWPFGHQAAVDVEARYYWVVCERCDAWNLAPADVALELVPLAEQLAVKDTAHSLSTRVVETVTPGGTKLWLLKAIGGDKDFVPRHSPAWRRRKFALAMLWRTVIIAAGAQIASRVDSPVPMLMVLAFVLLTLPLEFSRGSRFSKQTGALLRFKSDIGSWILEIAPVDPWMGRLAHWGRQTLVGREAIAAAMRFLTLQTAEVREPSTIQGAEELNTLRGNPFLQPEARSSWLVNDRPVALHLIPESEQLAWELAASNALSSIRDQDRGVAMERRFRSERRIAEIVADIDGNDSG